MDADKILKSDYLDILYDGRNKQYGSYELRLRYAKRMRTALVILLGITSTGSGYMVMAGKSVTEVRNHVSTPIDITPITHPEPVTPKLLPPEPPATVAKPTVKFPPPQIVADQDVKETDKPAEQDAIKNNIVGLSDKTGDSTGMEIASTGNTTGTGIVGLPAEPVVERYVQQMPEAPYDINKYLGNNINYPAAARENNIEGRVNIQFVVNEDGSITNVETVGHKRIGGGLEEEAMRVVKGMPKWKPGKQNGRPVKVYFTLPVSFKLS